jgi:hypothetical protein
MRDKVLSLSIEKPATNGEQNLIVGDVFYGSVTLSPGDAQAMPGFIETLKQGSIEWGDGRLLTHSAKTLEDGSVFHRFGFTCYKAMACRFPPVTFNQPTGETIVSTNEVTMTYVAVEPAQEKEPPIYGPLSLGLPLTIYIGAILLGAAAALTLTWIIVRLYNKYRRSNSRPLAQAPIAPPYEELAASLRQLASKEYLSQGYYKPYYFTISDCLKRYLGRKFEFNAEELTTIELLAALNNRYSLNAEYRLKWRDLFSELDLVKFTDNKPSHQDAQTLMERSLDLAKVTERLQNDVPQS